MRSLPRFHVETETLKKALNKKAANNPAETIGRILKERKEPAVTFENVLALYKEYWIRLLEPEQKSDALEKAEKWIQEHLPEIEAAYKSYNPPPPPPPGSFKPKFLEIGKDTKFSRQDAVDNICDIIKNSPKLYDTIKRSNKTDEEWAQVEKARVEGWVNLIKRDAKERNNIPTEIREKVEYLLSGGNPEEAPEMSEKMMGEDEVSKKINQILDAYNAKKITKEKMTNLMREFAELANKFHKLGCKKTATKIGSILKKLGSIMDETRTCPKCKGTMSYAPGCGAFVCDRDECGCHQGASGQQLARCYCGWSASGGSGRQELEEMGEQIDENY